uniref:Toll/interleukin-1 receptor-like protein n=1 Tax=Tanacetum cinerariifolium TaxID=118510 RepID=A0A699H0M0_TANCI|nr:Toll/interleukin-1 receptor-like protein [Tanacetum cinerariifolium]
MASSSSSCASVGSSISNHITYDVFLSLRGEDTRHSFTDHLFHALVRAGIHTFRDNDEINRGRELKLEIERAIIESRDSVVVFSENYSSSSWCLDELMVILEQRRNFNHFDLPVFYHVDPSNVRNQKGSFTIEGSKWTQVNINQWKAALKEVGNMAGMVVSGWPRINRSRFGLANKWHQSKDWGTLRREQQLEFIQKQLKKENQEQIGSCMKKISEECKSMLKNKTKEVIQHNTTLNQPTSNNRFKNYKCFQCKQLGHTVKSCPMDYKVENTYAKKETKRRMKGIKAIKPIVLITYPETIHFSTTCMIKDTDLTGWDEIWYVSNQIDRHVCYKLDAFCNIKEGFSVTKLESQKKFLFTYGMGEILIEANGKSHIIPGVYYAAEVTLNILSLELLEKQGIQVNYDGNR